MALPSTQGCVVTNPHIAGSNTNMLHHLCGFDTELCYSNVAMIYLALCWNTHSASLLPLESMGNIDQEG